MRAFVFSFDVALEHCTALASERFFPAAVDFLLLHGFDPLYPYLYRSRNFDCKFTFKKTARSSCVVVLQTSGQELLCLVHYSRSALTHDPSNSSNESLLLSH
jgi:hypothetical protein